MNHLSIGDPAPDFALEDHTGKLIRLSEVLQKKNVLLVFNLGFA